MRYLKARYGKVHLAKDDAKETLCGHEITDPWAYEIPAQPLWTFRAELCKKCEVVARTIDEHGREDR